MKQNYDPFPLAGALQLDLTSLIKPATSDRYCKLPTETTATLDLFKQKRCYGWWTATSMKTGSIQEAVTCQLPLCRLAVAVDNKQA